MLQEGAEDGTQLEVAERKHAEVKAKLQELEKQASPAVCHAPCVHPCTPSLRLAPLQIYNLETAYLEKPGARGNAVRGVACA